MRRQWSPEELEEAWTLGPDEHTLLSGKRGLTRLGFAVLLRFFAREGRFPEPEEVDAEVVAHVASQVDVPTHEYGEYDWSGRTAEYHRAQIREALGFWPATVEDAEELAEWLLEEVAPREYDGERLKESAYARLRALKVEPPTPGRAERVVRSALRRYDERFCERTLERLSGNTLAEMDSLLSEPDAAEIAADGDQSERVEPTLAHLRADPGRAGRRAPATSLPSSPVCEGSGCPIICSPTPRRRWCGRTGGEPPQSPRVACAPTHLQ